MSKRKLTRKQAWRIKKIQQERAARIEKKEAQIDQYESEGTLGQEQLGLITAHYGTQVDVESIHSPEQGPRRCHLRANIGSLVTGDRVIWHDTDPLGVVVAVQERYSELSRPNPHGNMKTVAANIDNIIVVIAPFPKPHSFLVDRYLVAAEAMHIKPVILFNKVDLIHEGNQVIINDLLTLYRSLGYQVIEASTTMGNGLQQLKAFLKGRTTIFVGQSGVGKSSIINQLLPHQNQRVGALSESTQKGTHTTTTAQLFHFPQGGQLIDSPGIREFGLWHMDEASILQGFVELQPFIGQCKFRNCQHKKEPGCAILTAYQCGKVTERRMLSYQSLRQVIKP
ncbi:ribosome biogenesis GTPase RsgA [Candidatus Endobugula sertula]|uniref:Small ribosomal subunit biogenesis GTPase RsgA n=1 Tax=Candidatus Endobugula sertula TaxID=62101 RepID=A0A1D2QPL2_9GAMM|nr:ribosome biogenesis GTPase RsgA [Candidatus Endobugula sertula]